MRKFFVYLSNRHEIIYKILLVILVIFLVRLALPSHITYQFEYDKGSPWKYDDLYAPFDFTILKHKDSILAEKKFLMQEAPLYFRPDHAVEKNVLSRFDAEFNRQWNLLFPDSALLLKKQNERKLIFQAGTDIIRKVYENGVLDESVHEKISGSKDAFLADGNRLTPLYMERLFTEPGIEDLVQQRADALNLENAVILEQVLPPLFEKNIHYDDSLTQAVLDERLRMVSVTSGMVSRGDLIVSKGEPVTNPVYQKLQSLEAVYERGDTVLSEGRYLALGRVLIIGSCLFMLMIFLATLRKDIFNDNTKVTLIFTLITGMAFLFGWVIQFRFLSIYVIPCCILPIIIRVFFDTRLALFAHVITVLFLGMAAPNGFDFVFMQTIAGMVTIFSFSHLRKRAQLFYSVSLIFLSYLVTYAALSLIHNGSLADISLINAGWLLGNALITLFSYPLIYVIEKIFGLTSDVSLMEMTDLNNPLLRQLSLKAPGTFQHSMQVANLAEAAIFDIGGNALLVRAGALYHDIGKMDMPLYFIENQVSQVNPHDELSFEESASIIISHVIHGIEMGRKSKLPEIIIDFIRTHHGTTTVQYFYQSYLKNFPEQLVDVQDFSYPGPLPFSKETAVLMMADSVEAASRSLKTHDAVTLNTLVDKIIESLIRQNQFVNCDITFKDITTIKKIFKKMLMSFYHVRVEYPR